MLFRSVIVETGVITDLLLMGDGETPEIGGTAMEELTSAILEKGTVEGVDAVSGATAVSYTHLDVYKRQELWSGKGKAHSSGDSQCSQDFYGLWCGS